MRKFEAVWHKFFYLCTILLVLAGCASTNNRSGHKDHKATKMNDRLDIYLLIGQSNMAGRAQILAPDYDTLKGTFLFTGNTLNPWEPAVNPLNKYSTIRRELSVQSLGPGYYFAKTLMANDPGMRIGLVVNARGGTSIDRWASDSTYFKDAVRRTMQALPSGSLKAILWHQGETDVKKYRDYPDKIIKLINSFRNELNRPDLPFIAGELAEEKPNRAEFNIMLRETLAKVPYTAVVKATGLTTYDSTHFDTPSMRILGERYAAETSKVLQTAHKK